MSGLAEVKKLKNHLSENHVDSASGDTNGTLMPCGIGSNDVREMYAEYEELLLRRDQLYKEAGSYMTVYTREFGEMITANFELKIECIKNKKMISYCRRIMNRGLEIDTNRMQDEIYKEMKLYYVQLQDMMKEKEAADKSESVGEYRFTRSKKIYRRLVKVLHPDINKMTMENENLKDIWNRIVEAYRRSDADELDDLEVLARRAMEELGEEAFYIDCSNIEEKIGRVERQINEILTTEPYTYGEILNSEEKKAEARSALQAEHDDYEQYLETLEKALDDMLKEGGVRILWRMN